MTRRPINLYKHSAQVLYNKAKPGLDKNTKICEKIRWKAECLPFEGKYVYRMLDVVMANTWRVSQSVFEIIPWIQQLRKDDKPTNVSVAQIRSRLTHSTKMVRGIDDFVCTTALKALFALKSPSKAPPIPLVIDPPQGQVMYSQEDVEVLAGFREYKREEQEKMANQTGCRTRI